MQIFSNLIIFFGVIGGIAAFFITFIETLDAIDRSKAGEAVYLALKGVIVCLAFILLIISGFFLRA